MLFLFSQKQTVTSFTTWSSDGEASLVENPDGSFTFTHTGTKDFSISSVRIPATPGWLLAVDVDVMTSSDTVHTSTVPYSASSAISLTHGWAYGTLLDGKNWENLKAKTLLPVGTVNAAIRIVGSGQLTLKFRNYQYDVPETYSVPETDFIYLENDKLLMTFDTIVLNFSVYDKINDRLWTQDNAALNDPIVNLKNTSTSLEFDYFLDFQPINMKFELKDDTIDFTYTDDLEATRDPIAYPMSFQSQEGDDMFVPYYEGFRIPGNAPDFGGKDALSIDQQIFSMSFTGISDGNSSLMIYFETPDDGLVLYTRRKNKPYNVYVRFHNSLGKFRYPRKLKFIFVTGNYVAMCKRYRAMAEQRGFVVPLSAKRKSNPNIDMVVGAANVWTQGQWEYNRSVLYQEMQALGIQRILSSQETTAEDINFMNDHLNDVLSSRYDLFQDIMDPANEEWVWWHDDWIREAYPDDIIIDANGNMITGWAVVNNSQTSQWIGTNVLCDLKAVPYARTKLDTEFKTLKYKARFLDTTFAAPYRECYHPDHMMTRTQSKEARIALLKYFHEERKVVVGTEDGKDVAIQYADYFEGMTSPAMFRVPGSGRLLEQVWYEEPEDLMISKFMVNESFRVPMFQLAFHDSVVAYWYWCDHNSKVIPFWDKKDLFNRLYGTPPMFLFNQTFWEIHKERFVQSYTTAQPVSRLVGYSEMVDHVYLSTDKTVQQTLFSNGVRVTVNFGDSSFMFNNHEIAAGDSLVEEGVLVNDSNDKGLKSWAIAVIVIVVIVVVATVAVGAIWYVKKRQNNDTTVIQSTII